MTAAELRRAARAGRERSFQPVQPTNSPGATLLRGERRRAIREERSKTIFEGGALAAILRHAERVGKRPRRKAVSSRKMVPVAVDDEETMTRGERKRALRQATNEKINAQQKAEADRRRKMAERFA
ncbi:MULTISPECIES: hypothetical protein [unclassified Mesorhizobium]|uniref:hypothetical protein n=1 Tax=unclassified Mesorhizobium TaxID=325217 RepID=UPI000FCAAE8B|nr:MULTISPECIES: hypothetical protein [unclassified Mesorhizobium]RVB91053.1 hypothetical protein EN880_08555 [Mesorhizobium sp. M7A.F.Ca.AU.002.03.1.1]RVC26710.1 hypothetical protein EN879_00645 [Mesorhizobium sp. M7A.F.Ca.AU.002.02.1.1]TPI89278.1 hypothetical protein FJ421_07860 [Mesorhizobium sp. B2-8-8]TPI93308.1 hypothetical protein FJ438_03205 [Mesorhizobium sp. B2-8-7]MDF3229007.1 hypothetical protein [Mesorhizobium sp. DSM 30133]